MRIELKKFLFLGTHQEAFFQKAQELGCIQFIAPHKPFHDDRLLSALHILRALPSVPASEPLCDPSETIIALKTKLDQLAIQERALHQEIARVQIFGDFSVADIHASGRIIQFFTTTQKEHPDDLIFIGREHQHNYFVAINKEPKHYPHMVEMHVPEPVGILRVRYETLLSESHSLNQTLHSYAQYRHFLQQTIAQKIDAHHLNTVKHSAHTDMNLFAALGWVPLPSIPAMQQLADACNVHVEEIAFDEQETPPTYLQNEGLHRIGEDLVDVYDTPSPTDKDPSLWVLFSFALFFGMILGDAGYGLVFLATALYMRNALSKRTRHLFFILSGACIIWGTLTHSFFGLPLFQKISLLHWLEAKKGATADSILLELSLVIGIIHLSLSFLRYIKRNWAGAGWILFMWGCYLYFPAYLKATTLTNYVFHIPVDTAATAGLYLIYFGIGLAFLLGFIKDKIWGLLQAMNLIQVFGDVLSYLRLYALGLAGAAVMTTINDFAASLPLILGILLFLVGHAINMVLGIMGGVIHGLRLNFIEWYHYSFEGGGKKFNPLRKIGNLWT